VSEEITPVDKVIVILKIVVLAMFFGLEISYVGRDELRKFLRRVRLIYLYTVHLIYIYTLHFIFLFILLGMGIMLYTIRILLLKQ